MLKRFSAIIFILTFAVFGCTFTKAADFSNNYFSITVPEEINGIYVAKKESNNISLWEKFSEQTDQGGFVFEIKMYKNPSDYIGFPGVKKLGELTTAKGVIYDVVFMPPADAFYADGEEVQKNFDRIWEAGEKLEIKGVNGNKYAKGKGMKGEDLYGEILKKYKKAFTEKWSEDSKYEAEGMSFMYYMMVKEDINLLDKIGYAYYDVNNDGIDELFIGEITTGKNKGMLYDIYTMVDRKPTLVLNGGNEDRFFVCNDYFICNESSLTKKDSTLIVYGLNQNSKKLYMDIMFSYNADNKKISPYAISQIDANNWESVSKKEFKKQVKLFSQPYKRFDFIPFSSLK